MDNYEQTELDKTLHEFANKVKEAIGPVVDALKNIMEVLSDSFLKAWEQVKFNTSFFDNNMSRKRFIKLLMSVGYQRNEANKIAWKLHSEKGHYTILDYMVKVREMEDRKNGGMSYN